MAAPCYPGLPFRWRTYSLTRASLVERPRSSAIVPFMEPVGSCQNSAAVTNMVELNG